MFHELVRHTAFKEGRGRIVGRNEGRGTTVCGRGVDLMCGGLWRGAASSAVGGHKGYGGRQGAARVGCNRGGSCVNSDTGGVTGDCKFFS
jgi:hypothetical protein